MCTVDITNDYMTKVIMTKSTRPLIIFVCMYVKLDRVFCFRQPDGIQNIEHQFPFTRRFAFCVFNLHKINLNKYVYQAISTFDWNQEKGGWCCSSLHVICISSDNNNIRVTNSSPLVECGFCTSSSIQILFTSSIKIKWST